MRETILLLLSKSALFALYNIVSAPHLSEYEDIQQLIISVPYLNFELRSFRFVSDLISGLFAVIGFGLTEVSGKLVDAGFEHMIGRTGLSSPQLELQRLVASLLSLF